MASNPSYEQSKQVAEASRETEWTKPSFGKELFLGNFRLDLIHPQPELDPAAVEKGDAFLRRLRDFLTQHVDRRQIERDAKIPEDVIKGLEELGALGMKIPEEYGGLGLSQVYYNRALAMGGTWHSSISTLLSAHQSIGLPEPLRLFGSEEQKRKWLPKLARDHISAFLLTEPDVGSDPARMSTTAVPTEDGTGYPDQRHEAVGHQRRDRRRGRDHGRGPEVRRPPGWHHRLHLPLRPHWHHDRAPQRVHGDPGHRELGDALRRRLRPHRGHHRR
jgi:hypothetical protein